MIASRDILIMARMLLVRVVPTLVKLVRIQLIIVHLARMEV